MKRKRTSPFYVEEGKLKERKFFFSFCSSSVLLGLPCVRPPSIIVVNLMQKLLEQPTGSTRSIPEADRQTDRQTDRQKVPRCKNTLPSNVPVLLHHSPAGLHIRIIQHPGRVEMVTTTYETTSIDQFPRGDTVRLR